MRGGKKVKEVQKTHLFGPNGLIFILIIFKTEGQLTSRPRYLDVFVFLNLNDVRRRFWKSFLGASSIRDFGTKLFLQILPMNEGLDIVFEPESRPAEVLRYWNFALRFL